MPNVGWFGKRAWHNALPYTEGLLIAILKQNGYEVNVIDANIRRLSEEQLEEEIRKVNPELVAMSALSMEYRLCIHKSFEIVKKVNPNTKTIIGGIYPTLSPEIVAKDFNIDYMVLGDGELRFPALLKAIEKNEGFEELDGLGIIRNGERVIQSPVQPGILDLDSLPLPDYSEFDVEEYMNGCGEKYTQNFNFEKYPVGLIMTSRGCPYECGYCASRIINSISGRRFRFRSPENIMKEIDMLVNKYGMKELLFIDDNFLIPKPRALKLMDLIIEKYPDLIWSSNNLDIRHVDAEILAKMKQSGCYQLTFSIESGCSATFKRMNRLSDLNQIVEALKESRKQGFDEIISNFVIGYPGDTWDDIMETISAHQSVKEQYNLLKKDGMSNSFDRAIAQGKRCSFCEQGISCQLCSNGPCRIKPGAERGVCGIDADGMAMRNFMFLNTMGAATYTFHAKEVAKTLKATAPPFTKR